MGVWIETDIIDLYGMYCDVTPCVGVWIETKIWKQDIPLNVSHPAWVCGLKLLILYACFNDKQSHPAWVCGLKP